MTMPAPTLFQNEAANLTRALVINLKTAKVSLTLPLPLLGRPDEVIE
jgi:hypothetical protein